MTCDPLQVPAHRYVTTENIRAGDIILEEEPWMWSLLCLKGELVPDGLARKVCHYCLLSSDKLLSCSACKSAWYCGPACQRADWSLRHKHGDCIMQKAITQMKASVGNEKCKRSMEKFEFMPVIRRLLLNSASTRLFSAKQRDQNGNPDSPLWHALFDSPSNTDSWVDIGRKLNICRESDAYSNLARLITWKDLPNNLIEKRILPSLVLMRDYGPWRTLLKDEQFPTTIPDVPQKLALGACLEMSKFPNNCNPNAVIINDGRLVRMIALEDISNLNAVRLSRTWNWLNTRYGRRFRDLRGKFGYDCNCARCCAGDSGETAMYGVRCPKWSVQYDWDNDTSTGCDGIATGLRRTDLQEPMLQAMLITMHGAAVAAVLDEPRPLAPAVKKIPAHKRVECQKCHARYDEQTLNCRVVKCLTTLNRINNGFDVLEGYVSPDLTKRDMCVVMARNAEQHIHPSNYTYTVGDTILIRQCLEAFDFTKTRLDINWLSWTQRSARKMLARIEIDGFTQLDLSGMFRVAGYYSYFLHVVRDESRQMEQVVDRMENGREELEEHERAAELLEQAAAAAMEKLRVLLVHE